MEEYYCLECDTKFTMKKNLYAHARKVHNKDPVAPRIIKEVCDICGQQFVNKYNYSRHVKQFHGVSATILNTRKPRIKCPFEDCSEFFRSYDQLRNHVTSVHGIEIEYKEFQFDSSLAFHQWKDQIQNRSLSLYVLHTSPILLADNSSKKEYYNCHRSYDYIPKGKGIRTSKSKGTNKMGKACPSRMEVVIKSSGGPVLVKFWMTHVGHSFDVGRVFLSNETRAVIAGKLKEGVTFEHILDDIRDGVLAKEESKRILLVERKDMHNIVRDFRIDYDTKRHQNDAVSIKLWVEEMKNLGDDCPVLYYKEQGIESGLDVLDINDFALIIMTSFQVQQLLQFGQGKVCIDGTHGTNSYDFQLYTLMTVDEFGSGSPVAFCFSNRADEIIFNVFFESIKLKVGLIQANVFMSDDAPAFYNAWSNVMSPVPNRLLCTWHVDRSWRLNLSKVSGGPEKKTLVYKALRVLLQCTSVEKFSESLSQILADLFADPDTTSFAQYFKEYYASRPQCWAYCYRLGLGINTNMYLESLHKILKHIYLNGRKVKRLDKSVNAVMKVARDSLFKRIIKLAKNSPTDKIRRIKESHTSSQNIQLDMVERLGNMNEFLVTSSVHEGQRYLVIKAEDNCVDSCLKCHECNICLHAFKCSCIDNVIKLNICKHIHACHTLYFNNTESIVACMSENNSAVENLMLEVSKSRQVQPVKMDDIKRRAELVIGLCDTASLTDEDHRSILNNFDKIINTMNKTKALNLKTEQSINSNEKIEKQVRLFSTKKRKTREVPKFKKPTIVEEQSIMDSLLNKTK